MGRALASAGLRVRTRTASRARQMDSFAGVGYYFPTSPRSDPAARQSWTWGVAPAWTSFIAALKTGAKGKSSGWTAADAQRGRPRRLRDRDEASSKSSYHKAYIENTPFDDGSIDVVIERRVIIVMTESAVFHGQRACSGPAGDWRCPTSLRKDLPEA